MEDFIHEWEMDKPVSEVRHDMRTNLPPRLSRWGYRLVAQDDETMAFERRYTPWWVILLAVVTFPIGLLFLLIRSTASLVFTIQGGSKNKVTANGRANKPLREGLIGPYPPDAPRPVG